MSNNKFNQAKEINFNPEIQAAIENLVSAFEANTKDMSSESLTIMISVDSDECDQDHSDGSECHAMKAVVISQGNVVSALKLSIQAIGDIYSSIAETHLKENKILSMMRNAAIGAKISSDIDNKIKKVMSSYLP